MQVDIVDSYYLCVCPYNSMHMYMCIYMCIYIYVYIYVYIYICIYICTYARTNPVGLMTVQQQWQLPSVEVLHTRHVKFIKHISNECNHYNHVWSYAWKCWGTSLFEFVSSCSFLILTLTSIGLYIYICIHVYIYIYKYNSWDAGGIRTSSKSKKIMGWNQLETYQNGGATCSHGPSRYKSFCRESAESYTKWPPLES